MAGWYHSWDFRFPCCSSGVGPTQRHLHLQASSQISYVEVRAGLKVITTEACLTWSSSLSETGKGGLALVRRSAMRSCCYGQSEQDSIESRRRGPHLAKVERYILSTVVVGRVAVV